MDNHQGDQNQHELQERLQKHQVQQKHHIKRQENKERLHQKHQAKPQERRKLHKMIGYFKQFSNKLKIALQHIFIV